MHSITTMKLRSITSRGSYWPITTHRLQKKTFSWNWTRSISESWLSQVKTCTSVYATYECFLLKVTIKSDWGWRYWLDSPSHWWSSQWWSSEWWQRAEDWQAAVCRRWVDTVSTTVKWAVTHTHICVHILYVTMVESPNIPFHFCQIPSNNYEKTARGGGGYPAVKLLQNWIYV